MNRNEEPARVPSRIPELIEEYKKRFNIEVGSPIVLSPNYVAPARRRDGTPAVIKIGSPTDPEIRTERDALKVYGGEGIASLLESDQENGVLLIERLEPGAPLSSMEDDEQATRILASVMKKLWKPLPKNHTFPHVRDWAKGIDRYRSHAPASGASIPLPLVDMAQELFSELINTSEKPVLAHGDLHHDNVLSATREPWLAIDPKGVAAEPAYDTAAMLRNPHPKLLQRSQLEKVLARRIGILSEALEMDAERILKWGIAQTVLSAIWCVEDGWKDWEYGVAVVEKLIALRR